MMNNTDPVISINGKSFRVVHLKDKKGFKYYPQAFCVDGVEFVEDTESWTLAVLPYEDIKYLKVKKL